MTDESAATSNFALLVLATVLIIIIAALLVGWLVLVKGGGLQALAGRPIKGFG